MEYELNKKGIREKEFNALTTEERMKKLPLYVLITRCLPGPTFSRKPYVPDWYDEKESRTCEPGTYSPSTKVSELIGNDVCGAIELNGRRVTLEDSIGPHLYILRKHSGMYGGERWEGRDWVFDGYEAHIAINTLVCY